MRTVHEVIDAHRKEILRLWVQGIRESPFAEALSPADLAGVMPDYLGSLGQVVMDGPIHLSEQQRHLVERHLSNRLRQGSTLNEILTEFAVLGRVVAWFLDRDAGDWRPSTRDAANLFAELHLACVAAMRIFNEQLLEDEQPVKRYLRLLQNLAGAPDGLQSSRQPMRILMNEALALVSKAVRAPNVALRLLDAKTGELIMSASAGSAADLLEEHAGANDLAAPLPVAEPRAGSAAPEGDFVALEVSDVLRARGVHSLVALRLASRHTLRGVMYIGVGKGALLSPSEMRQIATLGDALSIHLDHAQLAAELRTSAATAIAECQLRERFVSMLMHDLSGPLAAAKVSASALLGPGREESREVLAARIVHELDRAEEMVNVLVDAHRIRAGHRLPMTVSRLSLAALARDVVDELRGLHGDRFIFESEANVWGMWSRDQLRRSIWNLATNAIKFGARDAPVTVGVRRGDGAAEVLVHNEGAAIPVDQQADLFRPFSLPRAGQGHPSGWGLGLTLVWGCAEAHGGRVDVVSLPGQGTTFKLSLPYDARPYAV
jgi:signal transduction histidine kinase